MKHIVSCVVSNTEISWIEILYIIKTDQEGDSQYDVLQEIKEDARLEKTDWILSLYGLRDNIIKNSCRWMLLQAAS